MPDLSDYLARVGFAGTPQPDIETLRRLHRAHAEQIPYENLDVQFRRPVTRDVDAIYEKIVEKGRGGWCYEMNGLLSWALEEIGFKVTRLAGGVYRETMGQSVVGNHLVILVDLGESWLVDVGFGDGLIEPTPLRESRFAVGPLQCALEIVEGGWWRYHNDPGGSAPSFDFHTEVGDAALLDAGCAYLQTSPDSPFVQNAVVQRWRDDEHYSLRGRVLSHLSEDGKRKRVIDDAADYVATLREVFALDIPEAGSLWPQICARHAEIAEENGGAV